MDIKELIKRIECRMNEKAIIVNEDEKYTCDFALCDFVLVVDFQTTDFISLIYDRASKRFSLHNHIPLHSDSFVFIQNTIKYIEQIIEEYNNERR